MKNCLFSFSAQSDYAVNQSVGFETLCVVKTLSCQFTYDMVNAKIPVRSRNTFFLLHYLESGLKIPYTKQETKHVHERNLNI